MPSLQYRAFAWACRHFVRTTAQKAAQNYPAYVEKARRQQQKFSLPLAKLHKQYLFEEASAAGTPYYAIRPRSGRAERLVLYFFGGGFMINGDSGDFEFGQDMADHTQAEVWLVWYPLLPDAAPRAILDAAANAYRAGLQRFAAKDITLFGLSSGAMLCVQACLHLRATAPELPLPGLLIPHSPCLWVPPTAEQRRRMYALDARAPMLPAASVIALAEYAAALDAGPCAYFSAPTAESWAGLPPMLFLFGSDEVLSATLPDLEAKCRADGVPYAVYLGEGMMHTWAAAGFLPEARPARNAIYQAIRTGHPEVPQHPASRISD